MKHMRQVGIRALKQNASPVVAEAASGETIIVTDRGDPVAQLLPLALCRLAALERAGLVRKATRRVADLPAPLASGGASLSKAVISARADER